MTGMTLVRVGQKEITQIRQILRKAQNNCCAACGQPFTTNDDAVVDHSHYTGIIRGLLHRSCNAAEGRVIEGAKLCHAGIQTYPFLIGLGKYLEKHQTPQTRMIHPSHHMPNERKGVQKHKRNWR